MIGRIRLASGLVMLAYITMHLLNHALGLVSIAAMGWTLNWVIFPIWSTPSALCAQSPGSAATRATQRFLLWFPFCKRRLMTYLLSCV